MRAWQIHNYGKLVDLQMCTTRIPKITQPNQILVRVQAASINPIDIAMIGGYGSRLLNVFRCRPQIEFPLTLGRDFSGHIVSKGHKVSNEFNIDDAVYGVVPVHKQGSHAEFVLVDDSNVISAPKNHSLIDLSALPYASLTAWSSLWITAGLSFVQNKSLRVLILGASGGVGSVALQMLKAFKHNVDVVCSTSSITFVKSLGANTVFDYLQPSYHREIEQQDLYDIILDCSKFNPDNSVIDNAIKNWKFRTFVSLSSPLLRNIDENGLITGSIQSGLNLFATNLFSFIKENKTIRWAYFLPLKSGLVFVNDLLLAKKIKPLVDTVFTFDNLPEAFDYTSKSHHKGKVLIQFNV